MSLENIKCICPDCFAEFSLDRAIGEQTIAMLQSEVTALSKKEIQEKINAATQAAIENEKRLAKEKIYEEIKQKDEELSIAKNDLLAAQLEKIELENSKKQLENSSETIVAIALQKQKLELESRQENSNRELKLQIETLKDDLRKASDRANQGSTQAQGEAAELVVEETLKNLFPTDEVSEIKKGQRGADCVLIVKKPSGRIVGKINIESKRTKQFSNDWVKKLKEDSLSIGAHSSILITNALPSDNQKPHMRDGVWVCGFAEYQILIQALRHSLIDLSNAIGAEEVREEKAQVMFDFLMSQEFAGTIEQIIRPIVRMQDQLTKEKRALNSIWKEREALINGSICGVENLFFKIQGIAQIDLPSVVGLENFETISIPDFEDPAVPR